MSTKKFCAKLSREFSDETKEIKEFSERTRENVIAYWANIGYTVDKMWIESCRI
jgi:hypothetical protein